MATTTPSADCYDNLIVIRLPSGGSSVHCARCPWGRTIEDGNIADGGRAFREHDCESSR
jgi:hypothetical protein